MLSFWNELREAWYGAPEISYITVSKQKIYLSNIPVSKVIVVLEINDSLSVRQWCREVCFNLFCLMEHLNYDDENHMKGMYAFLFKCMYNNINKVIHHGKKKK